MMFPRIRQKLRNIFLAGLLVTVPTMLSFFLLKFLVNYIDDVSAPLASRVFHTKIPGIGFTVTILLVLTIGFLGTNIIGRKLVSLGERLVSRIPLVRSIYTSAKQVIETMILSSKKPFQQVVLVPYPRKGLYALGLVTQDVPLYISAYALPSRHDASLSETEQPEEEGFMSVFIPSTPNITGGLFIMFPRREVIPLSLTIEDGLRYLMTGGILTPLASKTGQAHPPLEEWEMFLH